MEPINGNNQKQVRFDNFTYVDCVGLVYEIFHKEIFDLCWKNKDRKKIVEDLAR